MGLVYQPNTGAAQMSETFTKKGENQGEIKDNGTSLYRMPGIYNLQYPINLDSGVDGDSEFGKQRVVFFINIPANSNTVKAGEGSADYREFAVDIPINEYKKMAGSEALANTIGDKTSATKLADTFRMKRLLACICLYVPNSLTTSYTSLWSEEDLTAGGVIDAAANIGNNAIQNNVGSQKESTAPAGVVDAVLNAGKSGIGLAATMAGRKILDNNAYLSKASRMVGGNSKSEQLFKGVDFRSFSYDYDFAPRSEAEAATVLQIIRMFRHHMLPEFADKTSFIFIYPSEFDIKYYTGDTENPHLEKQMTAVLTNCVINYTPNGQFNTFENGMPTHIRMQLQFKELGIPTKETSPYDMSGI